jgi:hypothetical protein
MYCTECGTQGNGKFCGQCGHPLGGQGRTAPPPLPPVDWTHSLDHAVVSSAPAVREQIAMAEVRASQKLDGEQLFDVVDKMVQPLTSGVSARLAAKLAKPLTSALGIRTGKQHREVLALPPGKVLAQVLVALAEFGHKLTKVEQQPHSCTLLATIPTDLCSLEGLLKLTITRLPHGTELAAEAVIEGQWYDWGKCQRRLDELVQSVRTAA